MLYREKRGGEEAFVCVFADDAGVVIPAWIFDRAACSEMTLGVRRVSIAALREARRLVDEIQSPTPIASSGRVAP
ncbi:hypothetical protein [Sorangium sp. So ce124]|uniref:hypothetical protein n=1 Tax=Sorangium sp. So ce124 TaxID=3133280 RepID=UPI003F5EF172